MLWFSGYLKTTSLLTNDEDTRADFFIQALSNLECGPTYHMKEVVLYDFAKDWEEFFSGNTKPVFEHFKRQRNEDQEGVR